MSHQHLGGLTTQFPSQGIDWPGRRFIHLPSELSWVGIEPNVDKAIMNFPFLDSNVARFWLAIREVLVLFPLKCGLHAVKIKTMR